MALDPACTVGLCTKLQSIEIASTFHNLVLFLLLLLCLLVCSFTQIPFLLCLARVALPVSRVVPSLPLSASSPTTRLYTALGLISFATEKPPSTRT